MTDSGVPRMAKWKRVSTHEYSFAAALPGYMTLLGVFVVGLLMTAGGVALLVYGTGGGSISVWIFGTVLVVFGVLAVAGSVLIWPWRRVRWVRVYEEGLRWKAGNREYKKRWEDVTDVNRTEMEFVGEEGRRSTSSRVAYVALRFDDDTGISFDTALSKYDRLAEYVQQAVAARQLAGATDELDEKGKTFGPVHVARNGVTARGRFFGWKDLRWLAVHDGELCAHHSCAKWVPIPVAEIPNYVLMLSLVKGLGRLRE